MNSILLDWIDNLAAIPLADAGSSASPFLLFLSVQLTLSCQEFTEIRFFYFDLKGNVIIVMSHELMAISLQSLKSANIIYTTNIQWCITFLVYKQWRRKLDILIYSSGVTQLQGISFTKSITVGERSILIDMLHNIFEDSLSSLSFC